MYLPNCDFNRYVQFFKIYIPILCLHLFFQVIVRCHSTHPPRTIDKKNHRQAESTLHNLRTMLNSEAFANGCKRPEPRSKK